VLALSVVGLGLLLANGCKKETASTPSTQPVVSAEKNSFKEVTSRLDPGGSLYLDLGTEQLLANLSDSCMAKVIHSTSPLLDGRPWLRL